jgi:hypothetical protein
MAYDLSPVIKMGKRLIPPPDTIFPKAIFTPVQQGAPASHLVDLPSTFEQSAAD